jgi:hypothetical protein
MGGKLLAIATMVVTGVIIADALIHPKGVAAFGNATRGVITPTYAALLGRTQKGYR